MFPKGWMWEPQMCTCQPFCQSLAPLHSLILLSLPSFIFSISPSKVYPYLYLRSAASSLPILYTQPSHDHSALRTSPVEGYAFLRGTFGYKHWSVWVFLPQTLVNHRFSWRSIWALEKNTGLIRGGHTSCLYLWYRCHWNPVDCFLGNIINGECSYISLGLQRSDGQWGREIKLQRFAPSLKWLAQRWLMSLQLIAHCANSYVALNIHPQFFAKHRCKVGSFFATVVVVLHWRVFLK
jgi:hypothetical protein